MVVFDAQELGKLEADGVAGGGVKHYLGWLIDFGQLLLSIYKDHSLVDEIKLSIQQIRIVHDSRKIVNVKDRLAKDIAESHQNALINAV